MAELNDLFAALKLLQWDQSVSMPPRAAPARARVIATLESAAHRRLTDPAVGDLIDTLAARNDLDEVQAASVRVLRRDYDQATRVPDDLVRALAETRGLAYQAWAEARPADDFSILEPHLVRFVALKKEEADALGWEEERYDALLDLFEPGARTARIAAMFRDLVEGLGPLVDGALSRAGDAAALVGPAYDEGRQEDFCRWLVERLGFDAEGGRLDHSPHPFTIHIGPFDVRQTIRTDPSTPLSAVYAAVHETGHALYEQGLPPELLELPVGRVPSLGMHESQSRLWENQVGRSRAFTDFLLPHLKARFPDEMGMVSPEDFYRDVNRVERGLIRVTADELTYNLHVALRFELEAAMFRDELEVADLPEAWNQGMQDKMGVRPPDDARGVLQDMHWSIGAYGYFPTYTIGNLYAAAIWQRARADLGDVDDQLRAGETAPLLQWLRDKVHARAFFVDADALIAEVTGETVGAGPLLRYLEAKYADL